MSAPAAAPQRGGSADLDVLWDELAHWPGYYVTGIQPSGSAGSRGREDEYLPDSGWFQTHDPRSWFVEVEAEGWEPRDRWFTWGDTIAKAAADLAASMAAVRADPHLLHLGLEGQSESYFQVGCERCEEDAQLFPEGVEWTAWSRTPAAYIRA